MGLILKNMQTAKCALGKRDVTSQKLKQEVQNGVVENRKINLLLRKMQFGYTDWNGLLSNGKLILKN